MLLRHSKEVINMTLLKLGNASRLFALRCIWFVSYSILFSNEILI